MSAGPLSPPFLGPLLALIEGRTALVTRSPVVRRALEQCFLALLERKGLSPERCLEELRGLPTDSPEWTEVLRLAANTQTSFLRDASQLTAALRSPVVQQARREGRELHIWCAACATGEEAYSLAMLTLEAGLPARVLATDLQEKVLQAARNGLYTRWSVRQVTPEGQAAWFEDRSGLFRVKEAVRERVRFQPLNLLDPMPRSPGPQGRWDLIFCRNVLIYFDRRSVEQILGRMAEGLAPEGLVVLGASESLQDLESPLVPVALGGAFAFQRRAFRAGDVSPPLPPTPSPWESPPAWAPPPEELPVLPRTTAPVSAPAEAPESTGPSDGALEMLGTGHASLAKHAFDEAAAAYAAARAEAPLFAEAHLFEGLVQRRRGDLKAAAQMLRSALFLEPRCWPAAFLLAGVHERLGDADLARRELMHTLSLLDAAGPRYRAVSLGEDFRELLPDPEEARAACKLRLGGGASGRK